MPACPRCVLQQVRRWVQAPDFSDANFAQRHRLPTGATAQVERAVGATQSFSYPLTPAAQAAEHEAVETLRVATAEHLGVIAVGQIMEFLQHVFGDKPAPWQRIRQLHALTLAAEDGAQHATHIGQPFPAHPVGPRVGQFDSCPVNGRSRRRQLVRQRLVEYRLDGKRCERRVGESRVHGIRKVR